MDLPVLLITCAIKTDKVKYLKMTDPDKRLKATIIALQKWKTKFPNIKIVIVDGTNFNLSSYLPDDVECLFYQHDQSLIEKLGKGSGEAQDIEYALMNSNYISKYSYFMKITGKRWVDNLENFKSNDLFTDFKCKPTITSKLKLLYINTAFFCSKKDSYLNMFENLPFEVDESNLVDDLEHVMATFIKRKSIRNYIFSEIPLLSGWDGTGDHEVALYSDTKKHFFRRMKYKFLSHII